MNCVKNASEAEITTIKKYIDNRYKKDLNLYNRPWDGYSVSENDSETLKKKKYLKRFVIPLSISSPSDNCNSQIDSLPDSLKGVYQEIEDATNFRAFTLLGGPAPEGGGGLSMLRVQSGRTLNNPEHGDFETYLGDLYPILKQKWCQWLTTTYSEWIVSKMQSFINFS